MKKASTLIFGNNEYGIEIAKNVTSRYEHITVFSLEDEISTKSDEFQVEKFDLSDDWSSLEGKYNLDESIAFCALGDEASNIFLIISLRSSFENLSIIALANNNEDANKMYMAGASKVIPLVETTAGIITDMIEKPIMTKVLHNILYEKSDLKISQIKIDESSLFSGKYPSDIEWSRDHGVIVLSVMHEDMSSEFIYSTKAKHHVIKKGDIFVVVGYEKDIKAFEKEIGGSVCQLV